MTSRHSLFIDVHFGEMTAFENKISSNFAQCEINLPATAPPVLVTLVGTNDVTAGLGTILTRPLADDSDVTSTAFRIGI